MCHNGKQRNIWPMARWSKWIPKVGPSHRNLTLPQPRKAKKYALDSKIVVQMATPTRMAPWKWKEAGQGWHFQCILEKVQWKELMHWCSGGRWAMVQWMDMGGSGGVSDLTGSKPMLKWYIMWVELLIRNGDVWPKVEGNHTQHGRGKRKPFS